MSKELEKESEETALEMMEKAKDHVTIDEFMRRHPITLRVPDDYHTLIEAQRRDRARRMVDDEAKRQKRKGN